jgi:hypothetical protein
MEISPLVPAIRGAIVTNPPRAPGRLPARQRPGACAGGPVGPAQLVVRAKMWISPWLVSAGRVTLVTPSAGLMGTATE